MAFARLYEIFFQWATCKASLSLSEPKLCMVLLCSHFHCLSVGKVYHLEYDPPSSQVVGLAERLVPIPGDSNESCMVQARLAEAEGHWAALTDWMTRFTKLSRPINGSNMLTEVSIASLVTWCCCSPLLFPTCPDHVKKQIGLFKGTGNFFLKFQI